MKIAHMGDIHLSELQGPIVDGKNARMQDTIRCMNYATNKLAEEKPDIILIAGDLFHKSKLWADEMLNEITIAANWMRSLTSIAPVVLMFGTANHDNIKAFKNIRDMNIPWLTVVTEPDFLTINTQSGDIQIAAIPGMDKGYFRTLFPGMDMTDENKAISEALGNVLLGIAAEADADKSMPTVLMAHYTVTGCQLENGETVFLNSDVVLPMAALQASNYDLVCLGHIHRAQLVSNCGRPVYYSGPLNGITFNEEGQDKGFWVHELEGTTYNNSRFNKTPSREFLTVNLNNEDIGAYICNGNEHNVTIPPDVKNKIVRVIYSCSDELNKQFNKKSLEKLIYDMGAFYVSEIRPSKILITTDKEAISENGTVTENLKEYFKNNDINTEKALEALKLVDPLISQVEASLPTGKFSGIFEPLELEVTNYRSYREEKFDFSKVSFATVNGPNGIGKSSFFMDSIADCLYEEPREGELTGWISNYEDARSGAITFTFLMGTDKWRVIRTRAKSGKSTLALQKWNKDKWEDHSGNKKDQTQEKIVNLLGMDSMTFKSCALIMQDNYGLFLEADKTERMQVLGNILGLSIYDSLHELVKENLKNHNRSVEKFKHEIGILDDTLKSKNSTEQILNEYSVKKENILTEISKYEANQKQYEEDFKKFTILQTKLDAITNNIFNLNNAVENKEYEFDKLKDQQQYNQNIVDKEPEILAKVKEYEETTAKISELKIKQPLLSQKSIELKEITNTIVKLENQISSKDRDIDILKYELKDKDTLNIEVSELPELEKNLFVMNTREMNDKKLYEMCKDLKQKLFTLQTNFDKKADTLQEQIKSCEKKAALIDDSNCPIDNPSCNFLKDALEAKNKIPTLQDEYNNLDNSPIEKVQKDYESVKLEYKDSKYNAKEHEEIKKQVEVLKKKKEQLLSLEGKDELLNNHLQQKEKLLVELKDSEIKISNITAEIEAIKLELSPLDDLEKALPKLKLWYDGKDKLPIAKEKLKDIATQISALTDEYKEANNKLKDAKEQKSNLETEIQYLDGCEELLEDVKNVIKNLQQDKSDKDMLIGSYKAKLEELSQHAVERKQKAKQLDELSNIAVTMNLLVQASSIDGVPFQIVRSVVDELSGKSNEILSQMTGGKMSIEIKMDKILKNKKEINALEIWINDYQRGNMPYLSRSGGQKVKAALSVAFALADLKANRAGIQLGMMFIDEPPFLDEEGTQAYADALELMHNQYEGMKVIAISHDPTMKARFPQSIDVMDSDYGSKIIFNN